LQTPFLPIYPAQNAICLRSIKLFLKKIAYPAELIYNFLNLKKLDLQEVDKEIFHVVAWSFLFIFCLLNSQKCDLVEVAKAMVLVFTTPCNVILASVAYKNETFEYEKTIIQPVF
jgi:hypothetical protein